MAERHWEQRTTGRHMYMDETGRVIGGMTLRWTDRTYDATAYDQRLGEYPNYIDAMHAVESACVNIEAQRDAAAKTQADGVLA